MGKVWVQKYGLSLKLFFKKYKELRLRFSGWEAAQFCLTRICFANMSYSRVVVSVLHEFLLCKQHCVWLMGGFRGQTNF